jgi:hypothetical protein
VICKCGCNRETAHKSGCATNACRAKWSRIKRRATIGQNLDELSEKLAQLAKDLDTLSATAHARSAELKFLLS